MCGLTSLVFDMLRFPDDAYVHLSGISCLLVSRRTVHSNHTLLPFMGGSTVVLSGYVKIAIPAMSIEFSVNRRSAKVRPGDRYCEHTEVKSRREVLPGPSLDSASTAKAYPRGLYSMPSWV